MERIASSEKSALKAQTPGDYPKDTIRYSTHGERLKSRLTYKLSVTPHCTDISKNLNVISIRNLLREILMHINMKFMLCTISRSFN